LACLAFLSEEISENLAEAGIFSKNISPSAKNQGFFYASKFFKKFTDIRAAKKQHES